METMANLDWKRLSRETRLQVDQIQAIAKMLQAGDAVALIATYRKDDTGGLDERAVRGAERVLRREWALLERKQTLLRTMEAQGELSEALRKQWTAANQPADIEDLYYPFRPQPQSLAHIAAGRGLEPLAREILAGKLAGEQLEQRAEEFVSPDREVPSVAEALLGAGHWLSEEFCRRADFRGEMRRLFRQSVELVVHAVSVNGEPAGQETPPADPPQQTTAVDAADVSQAAAEPSAGQVDPSDGEQANTAVPVVPSEASASRPELTSDGAGADGDLPSTEPPLADSDEAEASQATAQVKHGDSSTASTRESRKAARKLATQQRAARRRQAFASFVGTRQKTHDIRSHQLLAMQQGERLGVLELGFDFDPAPCIQLATEKFVPAEHPHRELLANCAADAVVRILVPSLEQELREELQDRAERHAVDGFARCLRGELLRPPAGAKRLLVVDPRSKGRSQVVAVDADGQVILVEELRTSDGEAARDQLANWVRELDLQWIVIGENSGFRAAEKIVADALSGPLADRDLHYLQVSDVGAVAYANSPLGREELPDHSPAVRRAVSLGRRVQDPLRELCKVDPASLGIGRYQHDLRATHIRPFLAEVIESCVNTVGVDLNTADPSQLSYVSGLNVLTARRIYQWRTEHGAFLRKQQLMDEVGLTPAVYQQAAGFLRIFSGEEPLDSTGIHPEQYDLAREILRRVDVEPVQFQSVSDLPARLAKLNVRELAAAIGSGPHQVAQVKAALAGRCRDPRETQPPLDLRKEVVKLENLEPGMQLAGTVQNIVDFGLFVDIGIGESGLVHISQIADRFVRDPHEEVIVGERVWVWVMGNESDKRRVSLTMIAPGSERKKDRGRRERRSDSKDQQRPRARSRRGGQVAPKPKRTRKPKPQVPITDAMAEGKEPMRTFGDLIQFYERKKDEPEDSE